MRTSATASSATTSGTTTATWTAGGTQSYGYDPANQLNDAEIGGNNTSYIYNGDGVRTAKETSSTYTEYVIDHNRSLPVILYDETAFYVWGLDFIARIVGSTQQYYHYDGLGSTRALTGNTGTTLATYNYDAFGAIKSQTGSQTNNFVFTGEWRDQRPASISCERVTMTRSQADLLTGIHSQASAAIHHR